MSRHKIVDGKCTFGYGLSYTTFEYSNLKIKPTSSTSTTVTIDIKNTGHRAGDEVVQLYIKDEHSSVVRPFKEFKRFRRITLQPGEKKTVTFDLKKDAFAFYDEKTESWVVEPGDFNVMIGSSSEEIRVSMLLKLQETAHQISIFGCLKGICTDTEL